jgi:hypothetical protein
MFFRKIAARPRQRRGETSTTIINTVRNSQARQNQNPGKTREEKESTNRYGNLHGSCASRRHGGLFRRGEPDLLPVISVAGLTGQSGGRKARRRHRNRNGPDGSTGALGPLPKVLRSGWQKKD